LIRASCSAPHTFHFAVLTSCINHEGLFLTGEQKVVTPPDFQNVNHTCVEWKWRLMSSSTSHVSTDGQ
jgi:hypothetical protein